MVIDAFDDRFHINVLCFVTAPHSCGAIFYARGAELKYKI